MDSAQPLDLPGKNPRGRTRPRFYTLRNITALILREMSTRYGRTPGGYVWAVVEPMASILFLSLGFSLLLRSPSLGTSFLLFYASGYLILHFYNSLCTPVAKCIHFSKQLLRYPAVNWMDAMLARLILNSLTGITICVLLMTLIILWVDASTVLDMPPIVQAFALAGLIGFGAGSLNCTLFGLFPIWEVVWSVLTRPLFLASGVIFIYEDLPQMAQDVLWYNPLFHLTGLARVGFFPTYSPDYINTTYVLTVGLIMLALGLLLSKRYNRVILARL